MFGRIKYQIHKAEKLNSRPKLTEAPIFGEMGKCSPEFSFYKALKTLEIVPIHTSDQESSFANFSTP